MERTRRFIPLVLVLTLASFFAVAAGGTHVSFESRSPAVEYPDKSFDAGTDTIEIWMGEAIARLDLSDGISLIYFSDGDSLIWMLHSAKQYRTILGAVPGASAMFGVGGKNVGRGLSLLLDNVGTSIDTTGKRATVAGYSCNLYRLRSELPQGGVVAFTEVWANPAMPPGFYQIGKLLSMVRGTIPREDAWSSSLRGVVGMPVRVVKYFRSALEDAPYPRDETELWLLQYEEWPEDSARFALPVDYVPVPASLGEDHY